MNAAAYGFRIAGVPADGWLALHGASRWPLITIERDPSVSPDDIACVEGWRVGIPAALPDDEVVHPTLGRLLGLLAAPRGIDAMHGGALAGPAGAWIVLGQKEAGKSTLLARCANAGASVLSDDVVALEGMRCLAGPRSVDLRPASARLLGGGVPVRQGTRRRHRLAPVPAEVEVAGVIHLAWGDTTQLVPLSPSEGLRRLAARRERDQWPRDRLIVFDLVSRPGFELRRPRTLDSLEESVALLLDVAGICPATMTA